MYYTPKAYISYMRKFENDYGNCNLKVNVKEGEGHYNKKVPKSVVLVCSIAF